MKTIWLALALMVSACTTAPQVSEVPTAVQAMDNRHPASPRAVSLPDQARWQSLYDYADSLSLAHADLRLHEGSGSSIYGVIYENGKPYGALIPPNSSGHPSGEVFAWTLSRALGISESYQSGISRTLTGSDVTEMMKLVPRVVQKNEVKELNRRDLLRAYAKDPSRLEVAFKRWEDKPHDWPDSPSITEDHKTLSQRLVLQGSRSPLADLISCDGSQPSKSRTVTFGGGTTTEYEAAREVSSILLIDALTQQFDRFTGGNMQTVSRGGRAYFVAYDNGGTWGGLSWTTRILPTVTRFDRKAAEQILAMDDFAQNGVPYQGLRSTDEFMQAFDIAHTPFVYSKYFVPALKLTADWIRQHPNCYF